MKKIFLVHFLLVVFLFLFPVVIGQTIAASLEFDPTTMTTSANQTFNVSIVVDAGSELITSTDVYVTFDASILEAQSVTEGSFFPTVTNNITSGKVYIAGLVDDPATSKTASGTLATVTFKALKDGTATLSFDCDNSKIVKNDVNATNILTCSENGTSTVTVGVGGTTTGGDADSGQTTTQLPKSGIFDNVVKWAVPGTVLLLIGVITRLILL